MSNLGGYQLMTTLAKRMGGPGYFAIGIAVAGYVGGKAVEWVAKKGYSLFKEGREEHDRTVEREEEYTVMEDGVDNQGLKFSRGECIRILEKDEDAVLIEKVGDEKNPYFVSRIFLERIVGDIVS